MEQKTKFDNGTWKHEIRKISEWVSTGHPDKLAIEDWKNSQPAGC